MTSEPTDERVNETSTGGTGPGHGGPARGYSWPPFQPGHKLRLTHGARSPELVEARAHELAPAVLDANPHLDPARDGPAIFRYAVNLARIERVYAWLSEQDDPVFEDREKGKPHGCYDWLSRWERRADEAEAQLAIAPLTRAKLGLDQLRAKITAEEAREAEEARSRLDTRATDLTEAA